MTDEIYCFILVLENISAPPTPPVVRVVSLHTVADAERLFGGIVCLDRKGIIFRSAGEIPPPNVSLQLKSSLFSEEYKLDRIQTDRTNLEKIIKSIMD